MKSRFGEFNPEDNAQAKYIVEQVSLFKQSQRALTSFDAWTSAFVMGTTAFFVWTGATPFGVLAAVVGGSYTTYRVGQQRVEYENHYRDQLDKMLDIYLWCANSAGSKVTHSDVFIDVLEAIYDTVPLDYLLLWDPQRCTDQLSEAFIEILTRSPHSIPGDLLRKNEAKVADESASTSYIGSFFSSKKDGKKAYDPDVIPNRWSTLYENSCRAISHFLYSYSPSKKCDLLFAATEPTYESLAARPNPAISSYILTKNHIYYVDHWNKNLIQVDKDNVNLNRLHKELKLGELGVKKGEQYQVLAETLTRQQLQLISSIAKHDIPAKKAQQFPYSDFIAGVKEKGKSLQGAAVYVCNEAKEMMTHLPDYKLAFEQGVKLKI